MNKDSAKKIMQHVLITNIVVLVIIVRNYQIDLQK